MTGLAGLAGFRPLDIFRPLAERLKGTTFDTLRRSVERNAAVLDAIRGLDFTALKVPAWSRPIIPADLTFECVPLPGRIMRNKPEEVDLDPESPMEPIGFVTPARPPRTR